jgi:hypothetical protein
MGGPTSSYATADIALRVSGALKPHHHDKVRSTANYELDNSAKWLHVGWPMFSSLQGQGCLFSPLEIPPSQLRVALVPGLKCHERESDEDRNNKLQITATIPHRQIGVSYKPRPIANIGVLTWRSQDMLNISTIHDDCNSHTTELLPHAHLYPVPSLTAAT